MKTFLLLAASALMTSSSAFAFLPVSAVTSMTLPVYGIYMSTDATCTTGMTATIPLSTTPQLINFVANPVIGTASNLPATIGCVVIVIKNNFTSAWSSGSYTGQSTTNGGSGGPYNDSNCNGGGNNGSGAQICGNGSTQTVTWPTQITTDAAAIGLTLTTGTCVGSASEVVPLTLSTNSGCTGNTTADAGVAACSGANTDNWDMPTSVGDVHNGTKMTAPSTAGNLKFVVNPTNSFGGTGSSTCGNTSPPLFSFTAD